MSYLSLLSSVMFSFCIITGIYILFREFKSVVNRIYFMMCLLLALWFLEAVYLYSTEDVVIAAECIRIGSVGIMLFIPLLLHFSLALKNKKNDFRYFIFYLPIIIIAAINLKTPVFFSRIYMQDGYWHFIPNLNSAVHQIYSLLVIGYTASSTILLFRWNKATDSRREKKQSFIIALSFFIWILVITA